MAGDLAEGDYLKLSIQKLQFEQDVSAAQLGLVQARAALRQQLGYQSVADDFDVTGTLTHNKQSVTLDDLQKKALENRPDLQSAHTAVKLANDTVSLAFGNRAKDWTFGTDYTYQSIGPNGTGNAVGVSLSIDLPIHDRNQGEIARSQAAVRQSVETESSTQVGVLTDVVNAYYGLQEQRRDRHALRKRLSQSGHPIARHQQLRLSARGGNDSRRAGCRAQLSRYAARVPPGAGRAHDCGRAGQ